MVPVAEANVKSAVPYFNAKLEAPLVVPKETTFAPAPVAIFTVCAVASLAIASVPVPLIIVRAPLVAVMFSAPDPDCSVVALVELVEPIVSVFTAAPVAIETVVADASVLIPNAPVPEFIVSAPLVDVIFNAPEPL